MSSFNTENVINMNGMFKNCKNLEQLNLLSFNVEKVEDMSGMFLGCSNLKKVLVNKKYINKFRWKCPFDIRILKTDENEECFII